MPEQTLGRIEPIVSKDGLLVLTGDMINPRFREIGYWCQTPGWVSMPSNTCRIDP